MSKELSGKRVAILVTDGFEEVEMTEPRKALNDAGAVTTLISPRKTEVQGWNHQDKGRRFNVDIELDSADPNDYDALLLPGGVANPDQLRINPKAVAFAKSFFTAHKPVAAICHGPWLLVEADVVRGYQVTSWPSLKTDLTNAGAKWEDSSAVVDHGLVTSRKPEDITTFNKNMIEEFSQPVRA